jgi:hypothetical protein
MDENKVRYWFIVSIVIFSVGYLVTDNWKHVKYMLRDWSIVGNEFDRIDPSKEIMHVKIGDYVADIPSNYFWRNHVFNGVWWRASPERFESDVVNLEVTWPDLQPWTPDNDELFREPGSPHTISISFRKKKNEDWPFHYFKNKWKDLDYMPSSNVAPGLLHYVDRRLLNRDVFLEYDEPRLNMIQIICDSTDTGIPSPSCTCRHSVFLDKYHIKYTFHRKYLSDWNEINLRLKDMFSAFLVTHEVL